jgi:hypothetical protein
MHIRLSEAVVKKKRTERARASEREKRREGAKRENNE